MSSDFDINLAISPLRIISVMMMYRLGTQSPTAATPTIRSSQAYALNHDH
jgi:hypothetical protein